MNKLSVSRDVLQLFTIERPCLSAVLYSITSISLKNSASQLTPYHLYILRIKLCYHSLRQKKLGEGAAHDLCYKETINFGEMLTERFSRQGGGVESSRLLYPFYAFITPPRVINKRLGVGRLLSSEMEKLVHLLGNVNHFWAIILCLNQCSNTCYHSMKYFIKVCPSICALSVFQ